MRGTISELYGKVGLEGIDLKERDFYFFMRLLEQTGKARIVGTTKGNGKGRPSTIYEVDHTQFYLRHN